MDVSLKQELLESAMVDSNALNNLEKTDLNFSMPTWMIVMVALLFALAGIQAVKLRAGTGKDSTETKK